MVGLQNMKNELKVNRYDSSQWVEIHHWLLNMPVFLLKKLMQT